MSSIQSRGASRLESFEQKAAVLEAKIGKLEGREAKYGLSKSDTKKISELCTDLIKSFNKLDATDQKVAAPALQKNITWASSRGASNKLTALIPRTEIQIKQLLGASNNKPAAEVKSSVLTKSQEQLRDFSIYKE